ncbi:amidohydrolase family protein, partial [Mycobacterium asiaticum]
MAVRGDVIAWLGSDEVGRDQFPDADVQDLDGAFVAPGFVDSHIHLSATGLAISGLDLRPAGSRQHFLRLLTDYAKAHPGQPIWGHGWDESTWPDST